MARQTPPVKELAMCAIHMSKRIIFSYVIDWILILVIAALGGIFNRGVENTNKRPFSIQDPSISYPFHKDTVSSAVLIVVGLVAPGIITAIISLTCVPGPTASKQTPKSLIWRRKIWEWNTAWMGLGLSLATAFMVTEGLKDLAGKPRPHAIARCNPDLTRIDEFRVGGLGQSLDETGAAPIVVSSGICQERDQHTLREIFASWPSGHSSFSMAGLLYLSLYLCAKFSVGIPYMLPNLNKSNTAENTYDFDASLRIVGGRPVSPSSASSSITRQAPGHTSGPTPPPRNTTAAPPIYLLVLAVFLPIGTAVFICVSRWFDFRHHGIDILSGALLGAFTAWFSFRYYHMPVLRGSGWAWGARSRGRAFWAGVGRDGYVGEEGWMAGRGLTGKKLEPGSSQIAGATHKQKDTGPGVEDAGDTEALGGSARADLEGGDGTGQVTRAGAT